MPHPLSARVRSRLAFPSAALLASVFLVGFAACGPEPGDGARGEWPQFRGPAGQGHATEANPPLR